MAGKTVRWGIVSTGGQISPCYTIDLLVDPSTRGIFDLQHQIVAVFSSSGNSRAAEFLDSVGVSSNAKAYGSITEFCKDPTIDVVYVASPHSNHFRATLSCLDAGKHVLCEKPMTVNARQAQLLIQKAREKKNLFLMEGVWTRFLPVARYVKNVVSSFQLGTIRRVSSDLSTSISLAGKGSIQQRLVDPELAGGCLLDLGIYAINWCFHVLRPTRSDQEWGLPKIQAIMTKDEASEIDETTTILLEFAGSPVQHAIATCSLLTYTDPGCPALRIQGDLGELQVFPPISRPPRTRLILHNGHTEDKLWTQPGPGPGSGWYNGYRDVIINSEGEGHGLFWEADEVAVALQEGRTESSTQSLDETLAILQVMDEIRRQGGLAYPDDVEGV